MRSGTASLRPLPILLSFAVFVLLSVNYFHNFISLLSFASSGANHDDRLLLVTAYFPLKTSKHSHAEYDAWLTHFMGHLDTDMYIFCPPAEEPHLRGLIEQSANLGALVDTIIADGSPSISTTLDTRRNVYFDTRYTDCLETPVLSEFALRTEEQWELDTEKHINNPDLYAIWNAKAYFVGEAVRNTTAKGEKAYRYYFWQDAGAMRTANTLKHWPDMTRTDEVFQEARSRRGEGVPSRAGQFGLQAGGEAGDALILFPFWRMATWDERKWTEEKGGIPVMLSEGSFFGGSTESVLWFESAFYRLFNKILLAGQFIGRDQDVFNTLMAQFPSHFFGPVLSNHLQDWNACGDRWFYYLQWLASIEEREAMEKAAVWDCPVVPVDFAFL